jgi:RNA recognition motif-containing protein
VSLRRVFSGHAGFHSVHLMRDQYLDKSRRFAFITFDTTTDAMVALHASSDLKIDGVKVRVEFSLTTSPRQRTPGSYAGRPTRRPRRSYLSHD